MIKIHDFRTFVIASVALALPAGRQVVFLAMTSTVDTRIKKHPRVGVFLHLFNAKIAWSNRCF